MWYVVPQFVGFIIFMVAGFAETNRAPFDLVEADAELVGGYNTEYGGGALRPLLLRRVPQRGRRLAASRRRCSSAAGCCPSASTRRAGSTRSSSSAKMLIFIVPLHLGPRDAAAPALRPAHELRLEGPAAAGHPQRAGDGDRRRRHGLIGAPACPGTPATTSIEVARGPAAGRRGRRLPRLRRDAARPEDDVRARRRGPDHDPVPRGEDRRSTRASAAATGCTASRTPGLEKCVGCSLCAAACPADCIRVVAAENTPENRVSAGERYAAVYEINLVALHLLRLLRGRVPVRRDHDGPRLRDVRLRPLGPHLHQGDAARGAARAHAAARGGRVAPGAAWPRSSSSSPPSAPSPAPSGVVIAAQPVLQRARAGLPPARRWRRCSCCCARSSSPPRRSSSTRAR